jgi:hypothetical protein
LATRRGIELRAAVQRPVDYANDAGSRAESIRKFLIPRDLTEDNFLLTPSLEVKGHQVATAHADAVDLWYSGKQSTWPETCSSSPRRTVIPLWVSNVGFGSVHDLTAAASASARMF